MELDAENIILLTIADLVNKADVSVRLRNAINLAAEQQALPFATVGDFLSAGDGAAALFLQIPGLGQKCVRELTDLIADVVSEARIGNADLSRLVSSEKQKQHAVGSEFLALLRRAFARRHCRTA